MPTRSELRRLADARIKDAKCLYRNRRYQGAIYLCGYSVEYALKARIATALGWTDYPPAGKGDYRSFITHDLDFLLRLSGQERRIKVAAHMPLWSTVLNWRPEMRYDRVGKVNRKDARDMIDAVQHIVNLL